MDLLRFRRHRSHMHRFAFVSAVSVAAACGTDDTGGSASGSGGRSSDASPGSGAAGVGGSGVVNPDGSVGPGGETGAGGDDGGATGALQVTHLVCEYLTDPLGIDTPQPRLSWALESSGRGQRQTAYEIVASSANGDVWGTGKVASNKQTHIPYAGQPLV